MTLNNIKTMKKDRGFTIVELLIVIVIIAILAAITIVAYNGIQSRANASTAKANAESVQKVVEAYAADDSASGGNGKYPVDIAAITTWSAASTSVSRLPSGVTLTAGVLSGSTNTHVSGKVIQFVPKGTTGACIGYWDASLGTPAAAYLYAGNATTGGNTTPSCS
jgi:prepilin-type N-terminal cleavage/methylation domain-containing protein